MKPLKTLSGSYAVFRFLPALNLIPEGMVTGQLMLAGIELIAIDQ